jgi:long-chain acyl-CoA synthetase
MPRRTLLDFLSDLESTPSTAGADFLTYDDGYRTWTWTYAQLADASAAFAARLADASIRGGDAIAIWSENRPEWIAALWGCLLEGVVLVPIDYRASPEFLLKVAGIVNARGVIVGDTVDADSLGTSRVIWRTSELRASSSVVRRPLSPEASEIGPDTTAEIIFTSGATAEPKGVVLTHRNVLANIVPIEKEVAHYRKYIRLFSPIRFLNLLPLSHMFGQAMATFVPPMLPGLVVFTRSYAPQDVIRQIRDRRISVLVCVPKMLEVLKEHVIRVAPEAATPPGADMHWARRWWKYRRIHRMFGFKFWAMVVGAAPLDPELEAFWGRLGFAVVQGYGLTETAPIVTLNHPLRAARGAVGKPIAGVEVRIADDGEILVRGENVTRGYYNAPEETRAAFEDGWFHTGDIGEFDDRGQLHIKGRKKEMIVTPEGLNVFPEDVERALNAQPGVRDAAVVGAPLPGTTAERVQAVMVVEPGTDLDAVVRAANAELADHQRIRAAVVWPQAELPRTEGTRKLKRRELRNWLTGGGARREVGGATVGEKTGARGVVEVLQRFAPGRTITPETTIEELGFSSLERVELMMALEEALQVTIDESGFAAAKTVADLEGLTKAVVLSEDETAFAGSASASSVLGQDSAPSRPRPEGDIAFPSWNRSWPVRIVRRASLPTWILPLGRIFARVKVEGLENLEGVAGPVIFASNHQSHFDTPVILDSLPPRWRYRVAPAMAKEFFKAHFFPEQYGRAAWFTNSLNYYLASFFFNAFPLPQREAGTRQTLRYVGELLGGGYSILIFPEGKRTQAGEINQFQPGVGMMAARLEVPVVPVRLEGLDRILHSSAFFPTVGRGRCAFGRAMSLQGHDYAALTRQIEDAVKAL